MMWNPAQVSDEEEAATAEAADCLHQPRTPLGPEPDGGCGRKTGKAELGKTGKQQGLIGLDQHDYQWKSLIVAPVAQPF